VVLCQVAPVGADLVYIGRDSCCPLLELEYEDLVAGEQNHVWSATAFEG
jgi:hypothetical protein